MTSNLGSDIIQEKAGGDYNDMKKSVMEIVGRHFRPEFINRVDDIVVFHPLSKAIFARLQPCRLNRWQNA